MNSIMTRQAVPSIKCPGSFADPGSGLHGMGNKGYGEMSYPLTCPGLFNKQILS